MSMRSKTALRGKSLLRKFESYAFLGGLAIGTLTGVLLSGPNFHTWPLTTSFLVILCSGVAGAIIGFLASAIGVGSVARGFEPGSSAPENIGQGSTANESSSSGGSDGGSGGSGGGDS